VVLIFTNIICTFFIILFHLKTTFNYTTIYIYHTIIIYHSKINKKKWTIHSYVTQNLFFSSRTHLGSSYTRRMYIIILYASSRDDYKTIISLAYRWINKSTSGVFRERVLVASDILSARNHYNHYVVNHNSADDRTWNLQHN